LKPEDIKSAQFDFSLPDRKPDVASAGVLSATSAYPPAHSVWASPKKRGRTQFDDQGGLDQLVQECVAHLAEEARASQLAGGAAKDRIDALASELDRHEVELSAVVPESVPAAAVLFPADKVASTQTELIEEEMMQVRQIAPLPKRARGKGLLTFLSGMAVAVVGMECLGVLAGMMEE